MARLQDLPAMITEFRDLAKEYLLQETVGQAKKLGHFAGFSLGAAAPVADRVFEETPPGVEKPVVHAPRVHAHRLERRVRSRGGLLGPGQAVGWLTTSVVPSGLVGRESGV